jgi:hypothetical protein
MAGHDTLHADGGWTVELVMPIKKSSGDTISAITIRPVELEQTIRWARGEYPSTLALLAEMSKLPESMLRSLKYPDVDRVLLAYSQVIPPTIRKEFEEGVRPIATPDDLLPRGDKQSVGNTEGDPRFPKVAGPVQRFVDPPTEPPQTAGPPPRRAGQRPQPQPDVEEQGGIATMMPEAAKRVG